MFEILNKKFFSKKMSIIILLGTFVPLSTLLVLVFFGIIPKNFKSLASWFSAFIPIVFIVFILKKDKKVNVKLKFSKIFLMVSILVMILCLDMGRDVGYYLFNLVQTVKRVSVLDQKGVVVYADLQRNIWSFDTETLKMNLLIENKEVKENALSTYFTEAKLSPDKSNLVYIVSHNDSLSTANLFSNGEKIVLMQGEENKLIINESTRHQEGCSDPAHPEYSYFYFDMNQAEWSNKGNFIAILSSCRVGYKTAYWRVDVFDKNGRFLENFYKGENVSMAGKWISPGNEEFIEFAEIYSKGATRPWIGGKIISPNSERVISMESGMFTDYRFSPLDWLGGSTYMYTFDYYVYQRNDEKRHLLFSTYGGINGILWSPDSEQILFSSSEGVFVLTMDRFHKPTKIFSDFMYIFDWK